MRICVLQSAYPEHHILSQHDSGCDPSQFTDEHLFEQRLIHKTTAKEQITTVVAEGFDFYFNFMWGQYEDEVAGIEACQYFESFDLPFIGLWSDVLKRSKNDFYRDARARGSPRVPGTTKYPLFVKPATGCSSMFITEKSVCHNKEELLQALHAINEALSRGREIKGSSDTPHSTIDGIAIPNDVTVQEFIEGWDHSVVVIEIGDTPVALAPERYVYPSDIQSHQTFLTFDNKFHQETRVEVLTRDADPKIFDQLQEMAIQAFYANKMSGRSWANVDIRVSSTGEPVVIEVNPMPTVFVHDNHQWEDICIRESFPGGHRALINTLIASHLLWRNRNNAIDTQDTHGYLHTFLERGNFGQICTKVASTVNFSGTVLELGCGAGQFGRALGTSSSRASLKITAIEPSAALVQACQEATLYNKIHHGPIAFILPSIEPFNHIAGLASLHLLSPVEFSLVMVRAFQLARKSLVVGILEVPDGSEVYPGIILYNHKRQMEMTFYACPGWKLAEKQKEVAWREGQYVYMTVYYYCRE